MKKLVSWIFLLLITLAISSALFITGKQHKVFIINGTKDDKNIVKVIEYSIDEQKFKKIRAKKKGATDVKGISHTLVLKYKDKENNEIEKTVEFDAKISKVETINISKIINGESDWIEYN